MKPARTFSKGQIVGHGWKVVDPQTQWRQNNRKVHVRCPHCKKDTWVPVQHIDKQKSCGCIWRVPEDRVVIRPRPPKRARAAYRREFQVGEVVGNGWTVLSSELQEFGTRRTHHKLHVRCHCGNPFWVSLSNINTMLGCGCSKGRYSKVPNRGKVALDLRYWKPRIREGKRAIREDFTYWTEFFEDYNRKGYLED